jgi:fatty acid desaturase
MARVDPSLFIPYLRAILAIRLINAFWVVTFFQPDEFFQALEPAWQLAFGPDSGAWITWVRCLSSSFASYRLQ